MDRIFVFHHRVDLLLTNLYVNRYYPRFAIWFRRERLLFPFSPPGSSLLAFFYGSFLLRLYDFTIFFLSLLFFFFALSVTLFSLFEQMQYWCSRISSRLTYTKLFLPFTNICSVLVMEVVSSFSEICYAHVRGSLLVH